MQQPLYQGSTPGRPNLYRGTNPGASGGGFTGGAMKMPQKVVRNTLGWQTNHTVNYSYVTRRMSNGSDRNVNIGQFVFLRKNEAPLGDHRLHTVLNVVQLNDMMYRLATRSPDSIYRRADGWKKILAEWAPCGVVCTEIGYDVKNNDEMQEQPQDRVLNCTVAGRVSTFNVFGQKGSIDGCRLYYLLKYAPASIARQQYSSKLRSTELDGPRSQLKPAEERELSGTSDGVWQFVPWADWKKGFPRADDFDRGDLIVPIYVGRISSKGFTNQYASNPHTNKSHIDVNRLVTLPLVEVFVDYDSSSLTMRDPIRGSKPRAAAV